MTIEIFTALLAFALVTTITPGPNNLMLLTSAINFGFRRTVPHWFGIFVGLNLMIILVGLGLNQIFDVVPHSYLVLKICSILYLLFLAWKIATSAPTPHQQDIQAATPMTPIQAALFQWVNPKAWTMAVSAIAAYAPADKGFIGVLIVVLAFSIAGPFSAACWVLAGGQLKRFLNAPKKLRAFNIIAATLLVASLYPILNME